MAQVGGTPGVLKYMLEKGYLHGDCMTVTGKTVAENLKDVPLPAADQDVVFPLSNPLAQPGQHIVVLRVRLWSGAWRHGRQRPQPAAARLTLSRLPRCPQGSLCPGGALIKLSGKSINTFKGPARCYDSEVDALDAIYKDEVKAGDALVIRYQGPAVGRAPLCLRPPFPACVCLRPSPLALLAHAVLPRAMNGAGRPWNAGDAVAWRRFGRRRPGQHRAAHHRRAFLRFGAVPPPPRPASPCGFFFFYPS